MAAVWQQQVWDSDLFAEQTPARVLAMAKQMTPRSDTVPRFRTREAIERVRPWVVALGLLALAIAFGVAAHAIVREHALRAHHLWTGVSGTSAGIVAHARNVRLARYAATAAQWLTVFLGLALIIPRRAERAWFRWTGWLGVAFALALSIAFALGVSGCALHKAWIWFEPGCALDAPCDHASQPMRPADWQFSYACLLGTAAIASAATLSTCTGIRWLLWVLSALLHRRSSANVLPKAHAARLRV